MTLDGVEESRALYVPPSPYIEIPLFCRHVHFVDCLTAATLLLSLILPVDAVQHQPRSFSVYLLHLINI